jgi:predicted metal-dependent HD superfamily phosphohydrolase
MNPLIEEASQFVLKLYREKLSAGCVYHDSAHTEEVVKVAEDIGKNSGLTEEEMEILLLAAWFHDVGVIDNCVNHETRSAEICKEFLKRKNYPANKIEKAVSLIMVTQIPQKPSNLIEQVLCDADLAHIGQKGFNTKSQLLRTEWEKVLGKTYSDFDWLRTTIDFISQNKFYTEYAKSRFEEQRINNLAKFQKKLRKLIDESPEAPDKLKIQTDEQTAVPQKIKDIPRGVETMFRNTIRTHVEFSGLADNKANIMLSVNTLLLTLIFAFLARKLGANPHLVIPTVIITLVSLTTLILAVLVTRPKITSGTFTYEDIKEKKANLLFFGNFYNMTLKDFQWGMSEMINDKDYLYGSMIKDLYFLGQVLGQKFKYLRICYNIFMYGLIISIIAFTIAIILHPDVTDLGI